MDDEVGLLPCFKRADLGAETERVGGVDRRGGEGFGGDKPICKQASESMNGMDGTGEEPGLKSVARTIARPASIILRAGGYWVRLRAKTEPGSKDGLGACGAQTVKSFFGDGFEMVGCGGAEFGGEVCASAWNQNCSAWMRSLRSCFFALRKDGAAFVDGEGVIVAEGVAVLGEPELHDFGDEFFRDEADVVGAAVFVFGQDGVGG